MIPGIPAPVVTHLWQSTVFTGLVWLAAIALRHNGARVRYWLWFAASLKFLVPFSWLVVLGGKLEWRTGPAIVQPAAAYVIEQVLAPAVVDPSISQGVPTSSIVPEVVVAVWLAGVALVCFWWWRQWLLVRASLRAATKLPLDPRQTTLQGLTVLSSPMTMEPAVVGVWRPVVLVPDGLLVQLTAPQVNALIAHERSHVRHADNLTAAVHMAVEALFWFHPLVWWIERRLIEERERACDEDVLRTGNQPSDYAEGILAVCRFAVRARLACVARVTGSDLRGRIESILGGGMSRPMSTSRRTVLAFAAVASIGLPIVVGAVNAIPLITVTQGGSTPVAFDVASVKPNRSGERAARIQEPPGRFTAINAPLDLLITYAYQISDNQLMSVPGWIRSERFDVTARLDHDPPAVQPSEPGERHLALRTLLAERFKLAVKRETRELPMYALVMARGDRQPGPMLTPSSTDCSPGGMKDRFAARQAGKPVSGICGSRFNAGRIHFGGFPLSEFAKRFSPYNGRSVIDRTGLTGNWDFELRFVPDQLGPPPAGPDAPAVDPDLPSLPSAMQEQLGLKLEPTKGSVEVLVIERVERPTAN